MPGDARPVYDSFVLRLWHEPASGRLRRVEIEHVQSGTIVTGHEINPVWILDRLSARLSRHATGDEERELPPAPPAPD